MITITIGNTLPRPSPTSAYATTPLEMAYSICGSVREGSRSLRDQPARMRQKNTSMPPSEAAVHHHTGADAAMPTNTK